ncbi:PaaI family thioesterase [Pyxidicoccus parkwayensis]|uniref:Medium/long-chain acyl-CoA thioesterase YigI n=1 Tax=Pyxidicoccus parkwayensis TaxID=2813578 RepID=A0ABX7NKY1_9BACT|nr:PaaI family thioesterase [Pyxidicoccus parkwaysis]QSQ19512.1 PaaI family thioesterase [Pyxidicoccus parkwaysis]
MEALLELGRQVLQEQSFSTYLGAELTHLAPGDAVLELRLRNELRQQYGFAHGGVLSYLADNALTFAGGSAMQVPVVTSEFKINYLRPAVGTRLIARARTVHAGRRQAVCHCDIYAVSEKGETLVAVAQGTIAAMAPREET